MAVNSYYKWVNTPTTHDGYGGGMQQASPPRDGCDGGQCSSNAAFSRQKVGCRHGIDECRAHAPGGGHGGGGGCDEGECTSQAAFTRRKHLHGHTIDECRPPSPARHGHGTGQDATDCGAHCTSHQSLQERKTAHAHELDACRPASPTRHADPHGHGGCGKMYTSREAYSQAVTRHAHQIDACRTPPQQQSPPAAAEKEVPTPAKTPTPTPTPTPHNEPHDGGAAPPPADAAARSGPPTPGEAAALYGRRGVFEAQGAGTQRPWYPAVIVRECPRARGTYEVDVYQASVVRWPNARLASLRFAGGRCPAGVAALGTTA